MKMNKIIFALCLGALAVFAGLTAEVSAKAKLAKANCFCKASWELGPNPSGINPASIDWGQIRQYTGLNPQREKNQEDCREFCEATAAADPRFTSEWWCANVIGEDKKPYTGKMIAYSAVGTKDYRIALSRDVTCGKTVPVAGFIAPDPALKERCQRLNKPVVIDGGDGSPLSARLTNGLIPARGWKVVGYNANAADRVFLDSFPLGNCRVCYAEMTMRVRALDDVRGDGDAGNDAFNILGVPGAYPPDFGASPALLAFRIWQPPATGPNRPVAAGTAKTLDFQIPATILNEYLLRGEPLDALVQDDTAVQSMQLRVWYY